MNVLHISCSPWISSPFPLNEFPVIVLQLLSIIYNPNSLFRRILLVIWLLIFRDIVIPYIVFSTVFCDIMLFWLLSKVIPLSPEVIVFLRMSILLLWSRDMPTSLLFDITLSIMELWLHWYNRIPSKFWKIRFSFMIPFWTFIKLTAWPALYIVQSSIIK